MMRYAVEPRVWVTGIVCAAVLAFAFVGIGCGGQRTIPLLSSAGIYALMSFTVSQRRRESGIRMALGADRKRIVASIFSRAMGQLAVGAVVGIASGAALEQASGENLLRGNAAVVLPVVALLMMMVGLLAAFGPARRGLRIEPTEALREQ